MINHDSVIPMWYSDARTGSIVDANDAALRFWGYDRKGFIGMPVARLLAPEELPRQRKVSKRAVKGQTGPWKCLRADGSVVSVIVQWSRMEHGGRTLDLVALHSSGDNVASLHRVLEQKKLPAAQLPSASSGKSRRSR